MIKIKKTSLFMKNNYQVSSFFMITINQAFIDNYPTHKKSPQEQYCGGSIFIDAASNLIQNYNQTSLGELDTLRSKDIFKLEASRYRIQAQAYRRDNDILISH